MACIADDLSDEEFASGGEEEVADDLMGGSDGEEAEEEEEKIEPVGRETIASNLDKMELATMDDFCGVASVIVDRAMGAEAIGNEATEGAVLQSLIKGFETGCSGQVGCLKREEANKASKHVQAKLNLLKKRPKKEAASKKKQRRKEKTKKSGAGAAAGGASSAAAPAPASAAAAEPEGEEWEDELDDGTAGAGAAAGEGEEWEDEVAGEDDEFADDGEDDGFADDDDGEFADDDEEEAAGDGPSSGAGADAVDEEEAKKKALEEEEARKAAEEQAALDSKLAQMTEKDKRRRQRIIKKFGEQPKDPKALREWQANVKKYEEKRIASAAMGLDSDSDSDAGAEGEGDGEEDPDDVAAAKMTGDIDEEGAGEDKAVTDRQKAEAMPLGTTGDFCVAMELLCGKAVQLRKEGGSRAPLRDALRDLLMAAVS